MKPEESKLEDIGVENEESASVTGDVIGDTAYSERFVLKILLKLANLDTLKHEIQEKTFEDDLCTLWDMTAERDVVLFLQKHDVLKLFNFALPVIESPRFIEIIVGIVGNMCCQKEAVAELLKMDRLIIYLLEYIKTDDSLILIQVLRLVSSSLFLADAEDIAVWMDSFISTGYSTALYFILKNSSNKELLVTALENLNTVSTYCNTDIKRSTFYTQFVTLEALESLSAAFMEIVVNKRDSCERDEFERMLLVSLQILLTLVGFDKSPEIYGNNKDDVLTIINKVLTYHKKKLITHKAIDEDLVDIIDSTNTILGILQIDETWAPNTYFQQSYGIWKALKTQIRSKSDGLTQEDKEKSVEEIVNQLQTPLSTLLCMYIEKCSEDHLLKILDEIGKDYEDIIHCLKEEKLKIAIIKRAANYRTRLKDNVDS